MRVLGTAALAGVVVLSLARTSAAAAPPDERFDAGGWEGTVIYNEDSTLSACYASSYYEGDYSLDFGMGADFALWVAVSQRGWRLAEGREFPVTLSVDRRWRQALTGHAVGPQTVVVYIGDDPAGYRALRRGRVLTIEAARDTMSFRLDGSSVALERTARCVTTRLAGGQADPFSINEDPFSTEPPSSAGGERLGRATMIGLLSAAGLGDATLLDSASQSSGIANARYAWEIGNVIGGLLWFDAKQVETPDAAVTGFINGFARDCPGQVTSGTKPVDSAAGPALRRFFIDCQEPGQATFMAGMLAVGSSGAILVFHAGGEQDRPAVNKADEGFFTILQAMK